MYITNAYNNTKFPFSESLWDAPPTPNPPDKKKRKKKKREKNRATLPITHNTCTQDSIIPAQIARLKAPHCLPVRGKVCADTLCRADLVVSAGKLSHEKLESVAFLGKRKS